MNRVKCTVCGRMKKPIGRDSMDNGLCQHDCEGYRLEPLASQFWSDTEEIEHLKYRIDEVENMLEQKTCEGGSALEEIDKLKAENKQIWDEAIEIAEHAIQETVNDGSYSTMLDAIHTYNMYAIKGLKKARDGKTDCPNCNGEGWVDEAMPDYVTQVDCLICKGTGRVKKARGGE